MRGKRGKKELKMKTTVKKLWEKYPNAKFVFWYGELPIKFIVFTDVKELEHPLYNIPFEIGVNTEIKEFMNRLNDSNEIWIDGSELNRKLRELVNGF